ncbi:MAG TPA: DUF6544 family protein, partial [Burkholderiales bacterium]
MLTALFIVLLALAAAVALARRYGSVRWAAFTRELNDRLEAARTPVQPRAVDFTELAGLPAAVRRYFRAALWDGAPMVARVRVRHVGTFNMRESEGRWRPFVSEQVVVTRRPGFDWNARIALAPGVPVYVHDAYLAGEGILRAAVLGIVTVADVRGTGVLAEGELMRFLAEAAWYPTALLPSQGVRWEAAGERSAYATL